MEEILSKLKREVKNLTIISDKQFNDRFSTSKHNDTWTDDLFKEHQTCRIRVELLLELISTFKSI